MALRHEKRPILKLMRLGPKGHEQPAVEENGIIYRLDGLADDVDGSFLENDGIDRVRQALAAGELLEWKDAGDERVGAPIAHPQAVICIGQNYAAHAAESGASPPETPIIFFKHPNTVVGAFDEVPIPTGAEKTDWEVELAIVIGKSAKYLSSHEDAARVIAGYTISNDVSERDFQIAQSGGQWSKGKCCENFNPLGPALVPATEVADPQDLRLWSSVNGEPRQDSNTADMIFPVLEIVRHLSQYMVLSPGDVINTGTPQGVALSGRFPYLSAGDVMEIGIEELGVQRQALVQAEADGQRPS
jgi:2,4-diketo-3-deoxy-L-fuconate hydrolase